MYICTYISFDLFRCLVCPYRYGTSFEGRAERKRGSNATQECWSIRGQRDGMVHPGVIEREVPY